MLSLRIFVGTVALLGWGQACAEVKLDSVFQDHMVLQRDMPVPIWGTAAPNEAVEVDFQTQAVKATADASGKWKAELTPLTASATGAELSAKGSNTVQCEDVLVGDVWICSGQSNMELSLRKVDDSYNQVMAATNPAIRVYQMKGATWTGKPYTADEMKLLSGTDPFYTATWAVCSPDAIKDFSAAGYFFAREINDTQKVPVGLIENAVGGSPVESWISREALAADPELKRILDGNWLEMLNYDWCRTSALQSLQPWTDAVAAAKAQNATPPPQPGHVFQPAFLYERELRPLAPLAFKGVLWYQGESNSNDGYAYYPKFKTMIESWRKLWGRDFPFLFVQLPEFGYDIQDRPRITYNERSWALTREAQRKVLELPATGMAVTVGIGSRDTIHPTDKLDVGHRLALLARAQVYGEKIVSSGPLYQSMTVDGDKIVLHFTNVGDGLVAREGILPAFVIAGADKKFVIGQAAIVGDTVVVHSPSVPQPVAVRYGWAHSPVCLLYNKPVAPAKLGLPAAPFRTDDWELPGRYFHTDPYVAPPDYVSTMILDNPECVHP